MIGSAVAWMFGTKLGRSVTLAGAIALGVLLAWWLFASHYELKGYAACKAKWDSAIAAANVEQEAKNSANDAKSAETGKAAADAVAASNRKADQQADKNKETVNDVYRQPIRTAPVAFGSCVHPVDARVQDAIEDAAKRARKAP